MRGLAILAILLPLAGCFDFGSFACTSPNQRVCNGVCISADAACECATGQTSCSGTCTNLRTDFANCGACGMTCGGAQACEEGACVDTCTTTYATCDSGGIGHYCANLMIDFNNCGTCGRVCTLGSVCQSGVCQTACYSGFVNCEGSCTETSSDPSNCGACGVSCATSRGEFCAAGTCGCGTFTSCSGTCVDTNTNASDCGACGHVCDAGQLCQDGACVETCSASYTICTNSYCANEMEDANNCGACGVACSFGDRCVASKCVSDCGGSCTSDQTCVNGVCTCGAGLSLCYAGAILSSPLAIATDNQGNVFITDGNAIRKIVVATGQVTTLAGSIDVPGFADGTGAAAAFSSPDGLTADTSGNLYVADTNNEAIRRVVIETGAVTTIAGTPGMTGNRDGSGTGALFDYPTGVAADRFGNLYVADEYSGTIRKIVLGTGVVTTFAGVAGSTATADTDGSGTGAIFVFPYAIAADNTGDLYVAELKHSSIRKIIATTAVVSTLADFSGTATASPGGTFRPSGLTPDNQGNLFIADYADSVVLKLDVANPNPNNSILTTFAGQNDVRGFANGVATSALFSAPMAVVGDNSGNLYVTDKGDDVVRQISGGNVTTVAGVYGSKSSSSDSTSASCVNLSSDVSHCGGCDTVCSASQRCFAGSCQQ
jgi:sugar lactone lactonase YvrE